jgi:cytochrome c-type biogenesis protein CcmH/NrfG
VWLDVAGGTLSPEETTKYVQHAADCPSCGPKLQAATQLFQDELTPEEEKAISSLPSASPTAQRRLAERLTQSTPSPLPEPVHKGKRSIWWPLSFSLAGAAAVAAIIFFVVPVLISRNSPADVQKLLAQAYTEDRQIEMRIPGAKHGDIQQSRGSAGINSEPFHKASAEIAVQLKKHPDDPEWLLLQAERDVLDWKYPDALLSIEKIGKPEGISPDFKLIRAVALFEKAEVEQSPALFGQVQELLEQLLQKNPDNTVILFDHAIACEKNSMVECALRDWQHFLQIEPTGGWADEARNHLKALEEKKTPAS